MALVWAKMVLFAGSASAVYALEISASPYAAAASESTEVSSTVSSALAGSGASSIERTSLSGGTSSL